MTDGQQDRVLQAYLAEYDKLRSEQFARMETQNQTFNFALLVLAAAIGAIVSLATAGDRDGAAVGVLAVLLLLPLLGSPLAFKYLDNEMMIHAVGAYVFYDRQLRIREAAGDSFRMERISAFRHLPEDTARVFRVASIGKRFLFVVPTIIPTVAALIYGLSIWNSVTLPWGVTVGGVLVWLLDVALCIALAWVVRWDWENRRHQRVLTQEFEAREVDRGADLRTSS